MKPVSPVIIGEERHEIKIAEHQDEYQTLPALISSEGYVLSRWELSDAEMEMLTKTKSIYVKIMTFGQPLQPLMLQVENPMIEADKVNDKWDDEIEV